MMGIKNEIAALRRQMTADFQRDIDVMSQLTQTLTEIDEARSRGYQHLAQVLTHAASLSAPTPLRDEEGSPIPMSQGQAPHYGHVSTDPDAYSKAVLEAHGDDYAQAYDRSGAGPQAYYGTDPSQVAERFRPSPGYHFRQAQHPNGRG